jgi:hypothetical protein
MIDRPIGATFSAPVGMEGYDGQDGRQPKSQEK